MRSFSCSTLLLSLVATGCVPAETSGQGGGDADGPGAWVEGAGCGESPLGASEAVCDAGYAIGGLLDLTIDEQHIRLDSAVGTADGTLLVGYFGDVEDPSGVVSRVRAYDSELCELGRITLERTDDWGDLRFVELAESAGGVGALYGDRRFRGDLMMLNADGSAQGSPVDLPEGYGHALSGGPSLTLVAGGSLFAADSDGVAEIGPLAVSGFEAGRTSFEDGSFLAVWANDGVEGADGPVHVVARHFAADATPLGDELPVVEDGSYGFISPGPRIVSTRAGDGVAVGFASGSITRLYLLDRDGNTVSAPFFVDSDSSVDAIALSELDAGRLLLAWVSPDDDQVSRLEVAIVDTTTGDVIARENLGSQLIYGSTPRIATSSAGAVVFADGFDPATKQSRLLGAAVTRCL